MIHSLLKQGADHKNWCEDFKFHHDYEGLFTVSAVFDGCSSGRDSFFASTLFARLFESICREKVVVGYETPNQLAEDLIYSFVWRLKRSSESLGLKTNDLLATIVLLVRDVRNNSGHIVVIGDGFVSINGQKHEIGQDNAPNYIAYHLNDIYDVVSFEDWYKSKKSRTLNGYGSSIIASLVNNVTEFSIPRIEDVTISTDGILSYSPPPGKDPEIYDPVDYFTRDERFLGNISMMERKANILRNKGWVHRDDLGLIRIVIPNDQLNLEF